MTRRFFDDGIGEALIDCHIVLPIRQPEGGPHERNVTHRPKPLIGKTVIISLLFLMGEPNPPEGVLWVARRHTQAIVGIHGIAISRAATVSDPRSTASTHHRLKRSNHAACWNLNLDRRFVVLVVDVRFAVGDCHHLAFPQALMQ